MVAQGSVTDHVMLVVVIVWLVYKLQVYSLKQQEIFT
jgi:uncharacterized membrane protein